MIIVSLLKHQRNVSQLNLSVSTRMHLQFVEVQSLLKLYKSQPKIEDLNFRKPINIIINCYCKNLSNVIVCLYITVRNFIHVLITLVTLSTERKHSKSVCFRYRYKQWIKVPQML